MIYLVLLFLVGQPKWGNCSIETRTLVDRADRIMFARTSAGKMIMKVVKSRTSTLRMKFWSRGRDRMLVRIASPAKLRGMATLKLGDAVWYYMPRTDRLVRVGSSMMGDSWMGSHFTNDDLVKETELYKHYTCVSEKYSGDMAVITIKPKPNAPVVWDSIVMHIRKADSIPVKFLYYGSKGHLMRTMEFHDIRVMDGRTVPTRMLLRPADKPSEYTEVRYVKIRFNVAIPGKYFSLQGLKH